jgi:Asp-tRNA(Asn)/Glu-tRNA(Gln) amidotransferase A subunit family amidase
MEPIDLRTESVAELARQVRGRERSARELTEAALACIEERNPAINAFVALDPASALAQADAVDDRLGRGEEVGPLAGIPIGVKDLEDAAGFVTTYGSARHAADEPAAHDSVVVERLRAAGCVVLGKTNTPEHGWTSDTTNQLFGATRNPWDLTRSPGGSSGGSAAALAAGMVPLATGSDGGGSIRIPSALVGLSGLKVTNGQVPNGGSRAPGSGLLGVKGPMSRRIRDVALALDVVVGPHASDPFARPAPLESWYDAIAGRQEPPARVLWAPTMGWDVDGEVLAICSAAVRELEALGTEVIEIGSPFGDDPVLVFLTIWSMMQWRLLRDAEGTPDWERIDPGLRQQLVYARDHLGPADFPDALDACYRYSNELAVAFEQAPLLLSPTVAGQTPRSGEPGTIDGEPSLVWVRFTYAYNMTRHPAGTVNAGFTAAGLPVGLQVAGRHGDDLAVLRAIAVLEDHLALERLAP